MAAEAASRPQQTLFGLGCRQQEKDTGLMWTSESSASFPQSLRLYPAAPLAPHVVGPARSSSCVASCALSLPFVSVHLG